MGVSPFRFMPPVDAILNVFLDNPVQQDFQVGVLSVVWFLILIQATTRWWHIDRCDGSNQGLGSIRGLPHHMGHTMEVWILKEIRTHRLFNLRTKVRIIRITVQEVQDTTRVNLMVIQVSGFSVLIPFEVRIRTTEVGVIRQRRRVGPPAHPVRDIIVLTRLVYDNNVAPGKELMPMAATTQGVQPWYRDPPCTMTRGICGP